MLWSVGVHMINSNLLRQILLDNRELVESKRVFPREVQIDTFPRCVLVGVRRCGKSYLLYQKMQKLLTALVSLRLMESLEVIK